MKLIGKYTAECKKYERRLQINFSLAMALLEAMHPKPVGVGCAQYSPFLFGILWNRQNRMQNRTKTSYIALTILCHLVRIDWPDASSSSPLPSHRGSNHSKLLLSQHTVLFHAQRLELNKYMEYGEQWVLCDGVFMGPGCSRKKWVWEKIGKNYWGQLVKNIVSHNKT